MTLYILATAAVSVQSVSTQWDTMRSILMENQQSFDSHDWNEYVFSYRTSCNCMPCYTTLKYNAVQKDQSVDITFEDESLNCSVVSLYAADYRTINDWFNIAIEYIDTWSECDGQQTHTSNGYECRDKSLDVTYDSTYHFPTSIIFDQAAMAYDGGSAWYFECFDAYDSGIVLTVGTTYTRSCANFTPSFPNVWDTIKAQLTLQQQKFNEFGLTQYVYSQTRMCFCMECGVATKFITVHAQRVDGVTFEDNTNGCTSQDLYDFDYRTINDWFDAAIEYCEVWRYCDDDTATPTPIDSLHSSMDYCRDKSLDVMYDDSYGYPTQIIFDKDAMAYDGGDMYNFNCFTPYENDIPRETPEMYISECSFTPSFNATTTTTRGNEPTRSTGYRIWIEFNTVISCAILLQIPCIY